MAKFKIEEKVSLPLFEKIIKFTDFSEITMTKLKYFTVDVFTSKQFGGNQLAVVCLESRDQISTRKMQEIAKEFNYSETTFLLPTTDKTKFTANLRIFTIGMELPFAGHPNVGSAYVISKLAEDGNHLFGETVNLIDGKVIFEETAGAVVCELGENNEVTIKAPEPYKQNNILKCENLVNICAECLEIPESSIIGNPVFGGCGLDFLLVEVASEKVLSECVSNPAAFKKYETSLSPGVGIHVFWESDRNLTKFDYHARMFFPDLGMILEDPATGSANCALVGHLGTSKRIIVNEIQKISQGEYIGRPSCLNGQYLSGGGVKIGGEIVGVMEGVLTLK